MSPYEALYEEMSYPNLLGGSRRKEAFGTWNGAIDNSQGEGDQKEDEESLG